MLGLECYPSLFRGSETFVLGAGRVINRPALAYSLTLAASSTPLSREFRGPDPTMMKMKLKLFWSRRRERQWCWIVGWQRWIRGPWQHGTDCWCPLCHGRRVFGMVWKRHYRMRSRRCSLELLWQSLIPFWGRDTHHRRLHRKSYLTSKFFVLSDIPAEISFPVRSLNTYDDSPWPRSSWGRYNRTIAVPNFKDGDRSALYRKPVSQCVDQDS